MGNKKLVPIVVACLLASASAYADVATIVSPQRNTAITSDGAISFQLFDNIRQDMMNRLFVEFDGADVTGMVALDGLTVTYQPPHALAPGEYVLKIYEQKTPGNFTELQRWSVRVAGTGEEAATVNGNFEGQYNYLLHDNLKGADKIKPHTGSAVASVDAKTGGATWDASATLNGFYDSKQSNNPPDEEHLMLGEYLLQGRGFSEDLTTTLRLGNHDTGVSNILTDQYYRRGASAQFDIGNKLLLTGFAQDPARAIGVTNISGVRDQDQRAEGVFAKLFPLPAYDHKVFVETGAYFGRGSVDGAGEGAAADPENEGRGWVFAAEGQSLDDKVNLRGEYAETEFNDGNGGFGPEHDKGFRAVARYAPFGDLNVGDENGRSWILATTYQRFGTFFRSLTNLGIAQDEERLALASDYTHDSFSFNSEIYAIENNIDDNPALPSDGGFGLLGQFSFSPLFFNENIDSESWLGRTTFTAGGSFNDEQRDETPVGFVGDSLDQATWTANAGWSTAYDKTNVAFNYTFSSFDSRVIPTSSYTTHFADLSMSCNVTDWLTVTPAVQAEITTPEPEVTQEKYFLSVDTAATLIPEKLTHTFHYSTLVSNGAGADDTHNASTEFVYQFKQASRNDPGYAVGLSGYYENEGDPADALADDEKYKVFLSLKISAPFGF